MNFFMQRGCARDTRGQVPSSKTQQSRFSRGKCNRNLCQKTYQLIRTHYNFEMNLFVFPSKNCLFKF